MAYQFCPRCGATHRRVSRECRTEGCGSRTIIATKNMQALAQRFSDCDFNILAATSSISATADKTYTSVHLSIEFTEFYDIDKVFVYLPDGWSAYHTFSIWYGIVRDDITELTCDFNYYYMGFGTLKEAIQIEVDKMMEWLSNDGHIACMLLSGFWL